MNDKTPDVFHAIADGNRRRLLDLLRGQERSVQELVPHLGISIGAVSQHLKILLEAGLVSRRKQGRHRYYRADPDGLRSAYEWIARHQSFWDERFDRLADIFKSHHHE